MYNGGILTAEIKMHGKFWWGNLWGKISAIIFTVSLALIQLQLRIINPTVNLTLK
jgi:hypothetical protein